MRPLPVPALHFGLSAALIFGVVACHAPLQSQGLQDDQATRHAAALPAAMATGFIGISVGEPSTLSLGSTSTHLDSLQPAASNQATERPTFAKLPFGAISVSIKWPPRPRYQAQTIPTSANTLRLRIVGNDGKDLLAAFLFRPQGAQSFDSQTHEFLLPAQQGMLVEVRAYPDTQDQLKAKSDNLPLYQGSNPYYDMTGRRVLAEGVENNFGISPLKKVPISLVMDNSQLVAGIGGGGFNQGGDPYYGNYLTFARYAEMSGPSHVFHDHYSPDGNPASRRDRLLFIDYPKFLDISAPPERDVVRMISHDGLVGNADNPGVPVMFQLGGGGKNQPGTWGFGNPPKYAVLVSPTKLAWLGQGNSSFLYITEPKTVSSPSRLVKLAQIANSATVGTESDYDPAAGSVRNLVSVSIAPDSGRPVVVDALSHQVLTNFGTVPVPLFSTLASASKAATISAQAQTLLLDGPQVVAASSSTDLAVVDGQSIIRWQNWQARVIAGTGVNSVGNCTGSNCNGADGTSVSITSPVDAVFDQSRTYLFVADNSTSSCVYQLGPFPSKLSDPVPYHVINGFGAVPTAVAASPNTPKLLYVLMGDNSVRRVYEGGDGLGNLDPTPLRIPGIGGTVGMTCGTVPGTSTDILYFSTSDNNVQSFAIGSAGASRLFSGGDEFSLQPDDLAVGDGNVPANYWPGNSDPSDNWASLMHPSYLTSDATGNIYVADTTNNRIRMIRVDPANPNTPKLVQSLTTTNMSAQPPIIPVNQPQGVDVDEYGDVFIANTGWNVISVWQPSMGFSSLFRQDIAGTNVTPGSYDGDNMNSNLIQLQAPTAIRVERNAQNRQRRVFFIDGGVRIRMLTPHHPESTRPQQAGYFEYLISTIAGDKANSGIKISHPVDISLDQRGYLYVADGPDLVRIDPTSGSSAKIYTAPDGTLTSISVDATKGELYFTVSGAKQNTIRKLQLP